jgi:hypothetical protein
MVRVSLHVLRNTLTLGGYFSAGRLGHLVGTATGGTGGNANIGGGGGGAAFANGPSTAPKGGNGGKGGP